MYKLSAEEKVSLVMAYTQTGLVRGEVVTRDSVRINTWLRTDSAPDYLRLFKAQWLQSVGGAVKPTNQAELLLPVPMLLGFHLAPPAQESLDYNEREDNRVNKPVAIYMGLFVVNGNIRASAQTDLVNALQLSHSLWTSVYGAEISSPQIPQMPPMQIPMLVVRTAQVVIVPQQ